MNDILDGLKLKTVHSSFCKCAKFAKPANFILCDFYKTKNYISIPFNKPISKIINLSNNASLERK